MPKKFSLKTFELLRDAGLEKLHTKDMLQIITYINKDIIDDIIHAVGDRNGNVSFKNFWGYILEIVRRAKENNVYTPTQVNNK